MSVEKMSWKKFDKTIDRLADEIKKSGTLADVDGIFGIPRGGLVPAVALSHKLKLPLTRFPDSRTLIVDNIADTGKTLIKFEHHHAVTVTLFYHKNSAVKPTFTVHEKKDKWIQFPWE